MTRSRRAGLRQLENKRQRREEERRGETRDVECVWVWDGLYRVSFVIRKKRVVIVIDESDMDTCKTASSPSPYSPP